MSNNVQSAFLVPYFGKLPPYFKFWAASCESNTKNFHWYVYNDKLDRQVSVNSAVTLIPYQFEEMKTDFEKILGISIPGKHLRRICDYRIMFYFIRKKRENLDGFDFIGYTDMDMVYGDIMRFMPEKPLQYSIISANQGRPCGPFTLMNRTQLHLLSEWDHVKTEMEQVEHRCFDENPQLIKVLSTSLDPFCQAYPLQPQMAKTMNSRHHYGVWDRGRITVYDCWSRKKEGGFYHFSRYKDKSRFKIDQNLCKEDSWGIFKFGIADAERLWDKIRMKVSLYI